MTGDDQGPEGLLVSLLHPTDDRFVHVAPPCSNQDFPGSTTEGEEGTRIFLNFLWTAP